MSSTPALYQGTNISSSTLRPRNTRLISYLDDGNDDSGVGTSSLSSESSSIAAPALPNSTPVSRSHSTHNKQNGPRTQSSSHGRSVSASGGLWDHWSSIQDIASTFLGSDVSNDVVRKRSKTKKPTWMKQDKTYSSTQSQVEWGPSGKKSDLSHKDDIEERKAMVQAKKREALLLSNAQDMKDALGKYKRKDSNTNLVTNDTTESQGDVLVYRHQVNTQDTLAGVTIKYSCQPEIFRKVNRFWPNDNIQRRKHVFLPIEACAIRGRKVDNLHALNLLHTETQLAGEDAKRKVSLENPSFSAFPDLETTIPTQMASAVQSEDEKEYKHEAWVSLPSFTQPVEILRISRHALGYFPPPRRKSNSSVFLDSPISTPRSSFDKLRHPPSHAAQQAQLQHQISTSFDASPSRRPHFPLHVAHGSRERSSSTVSNPSTSSNTVISAMRGPGGVGNLRGLRTEIARPGPAEDPLNKKFARYVPHMLPPDEELLSANFARSLAMTPSLRTTPRASSDSIRSSRSNSSTMPAAIEGWMKKITGSGAPSAATSPLRRRGDVNTASVSGSMGDLIELEVNTDSYFGAQSGSEEDLTPRAIPAMKLGDAFTPDDGRKTDEELLNDRFPIRGRIKRAYETK